MSTEMSLTEMSSTSATHREDLEKFDYFQPLKGKESDFRDLLGFPVRQAVRSREGRQGALGNFRGVELLPDGRV